MTTSPPNEPTFGTERLDVGPWHHIAEAHGLDLHEVVQTVLTSETTNELPPGWQGEYSLLRARGWVRARDDEAVGLLACDRASGEPIALVIIADDADEDDGAWHIGFVVVRRHWGLGFASELVDGLATWARSAHEVTHLHGGVSVRNAASARVLEKLGFQPTARAPDGTTMYSLDVSGGQ